MKTSKKPIFWYVPLALLFYSCAPDEDLYTEVSIDAELESQIVALAGSLGALVLPENDNLGDIPADPSNPLTQEKVALGQLLFHETGLGTVPEMQLGVRTYSCASCHNPGSGFQSGLRQGIGEGGIGFGQSGESRVVNPLYDADRVDVQAIRPPTILNAAFQDVVLWNGELGGVKTNAGTQANWTPGTPRENNSLGFEGLETQAIAGMGVHRLSVSPELVENGPYKSFFDNAFPDVPEEYRYTDFQAAMAISSFVRTVMATEAPFQKWLKGDRRYLSEAEKEGALLFFGKANCYACHNGPGFNGMAFHALGMPDFNESQVHGEVPETVKKGRGGFTNNPEDDYKFKTPTLYNLSDVQFLGHGGSFGTVKQVIEYKNNAIAENTDVPQSQLSEHFVPLELSPEEIEKLALFLNNGLRDPDLERFVPVTLPTGNCFPVADEEGRGDLGCN
ncbi:MAG: cytochrome c peroxidase [Bacteroidota bacterium]